MMYRAGSFKYVRLRLPKFTTQRSKVYLYRLKNVKGHKVRLICLRKVRASKPKLTKSAQGSVNLKRKKYIKLNKVAKVTLTKEKGTFVAKVNKTSPGRKMKNEDCIKMVVDVVKNFRFKKSQEEISLFCA